MNETVRKEATPEGGDPFAALAEAFAGRRALLLDDDPALAEHVASRLLAAGFQAVDRFEAGEAALEAAQGRPYDILVLDRLTAGLDGLETLKRLRASTGPSCDAPALMLTALTGERQRVEGLLGGADDYLSKPVGDEELLARVAAQLRRVARRARPSGELINGPLRLSPGARTLTLATAEGERPIDLSPLEFAIVRELMTARGQPVTKTMLWDRCWIEWTFLPDNFVNIIDARVSALRRRLREQAPEIGERLHPLIVAARSQSLVFRDLDAA